MEKLLQISSGKGPKECCYAVQKVFDILEKEASEKGLKITIIEKQIEDSFLSSILFSIDGKNISAFLKRWRGSIQWICQSPFRPNHPRKNWFIAILELANSLDELTFTEKDIYFQTMRSSGAGGQHVNKVSSAVRAIHHPTGISVQVMDSRSQLQNKQIAIERVKQEILSMNEKNYVDFKKSKWITQNHIERGNPVLTFVGTKFKEKN